MSSIDHFDFLLRAYFLYAKSLPSRSEAYKMGGEWHMLGIVEETEIVCIMGLMELTEYTPQKGTEKR